MKLFNNKKEKKCKNCPLFEVKNKRCRVLVRLDENTVEKLPVDANDDCWWLQFDEGEVFVDQLIWRHKNGKDGPVEIEYPVGFFK